MTPDISIPRLTCLDCGCVVDEDGGPWVPCPAIYKTYREVIGLMRGKWLSADDTARDLDDALRLIITHVADSRARMARLAEARQEVML